MVTPPQLPDWLDHDTLLGKLLRQVVTDSTTAVNNNHSQTAQARIKFNTEPFNLFLLTFLIQYVNFKNFGILNIFRYRKNALNLVLVKN